MNSSTRVSLIVGARSSPLSKVQVEEVLLELRAFHPDVTFEPVWLETTGDLDLNTSLRLLEKTDFFTREVDSLQLSGGCRIAIHSAKDLSSPLPQGLVVVALTRGVDPSDALVFRQGECLEGLQRGAKVGTSSLRREDNIRSLRADLVCKDIRGTINARLAQLDAGSFDAVVIAEAALIRLGLTSRSRVPLPGPIAPLQGQLAIVAREGDLEMQELFACLDRRYTQDHLTIGPQTSSKPRGSTGSEAQLLSDLGYNK